jgi:CheY-like chemotaxis protein
LSEDWEPPAFTSAASLAVAGRRSATVLVVDDKEAVRASVAEVLRTVGYTVTSSGDGLDALRLLGTIRFDALVLDLRLPRLGGAELLGRLPAPPPTVVLSGVQMASADIGEVGPAVIAQLRKPVAPQLLIDVVGAAVAASNRRSDGAGTMSSEAVTVSSTPGPLSGFESGGAPIR